MYLIGSIEKQEKNVLFPSAEPHYLFDFELSKARLLEEQVVLPCYVVLENENIDEVIKKFPSQGSLKILIGIDKGTRVYERVHKGKADHIEVTNRCDIDFAILYEPLNVVEFLLHLHQGSRLESTELFQECETYYQSLDEWFFNHKNFFKYNKFFQTLERKVIERYSRLKDKGSSVKLLNCDGTELTFIKKR